MLEATSTQNIDEIRDDVVIIDLNLEEQKKMVEVINHLMFWFFLCFFMILFFVNFFCFVCREFNLYFERNI